MHLVVSSKRARSVGDWIRSRVGGLPLVIRNGLTARNASKNGSMSTTRSFSTGRPRIGSMVMVSGLPFLGSRSRIRTLQANRLTPLIRIASEPHTPCAQDRRNVSVPSR